MERDGEILLVQEAYAGEVPAFAALRWEPEAVARAGDAVGRERAYSEEERSQRPARPELDGEPGGVDRQLGRHVEGADGCGQRGQFGRGRGPYPKALCDVGDDVETLEADATAA